LYYKNSNIVQVEKLSINKLKWIRNLHSKKFRESEGFYIAEGEKILREIVAVDPSSIYFIVCSKTTLEILENYSEFDLFIASPNEFERISLLKAPQGILLVLKSKISAVSSLNLTENILVIYNIQDPGNLGTILRTADWFGIKQVYCSKNTVECYNPRVVQASMGSLFRTTIIYGDLPEFLSQQKLPIYGALLNGQSCYSQKIAKNAILIIGNEGNGISKEIIDLIQHPITIPGDGNGESLNVAVACGILLSYWVKS
jgi:TrmH family RNA methyltransferase